MDTYIVIHTYIYRVRERKKCFTTVYTLKLENKVTRRRAAELEALAAHHPKLGSWSQIQGPKRVLQQRGFQKDKVQWIYSGITDPLAAEPRSNQYKLSKWP